MIQCRKTTLANGLRVLAIEMPHLHSAEIAIYIKAGGRNDPQDKAGLSHFLEHMLFRGTSDYPTTLHLEQAFEAIGGSVNAATDSETTCFYSRVHPSLVAEGLALFASMLMRPTLQGLEVEKRIITEEALEDINEQGEEVNPDNLASRLLWPDHPLGVPTVGYLSTIAGFAEADLRGHLERYYVPGNAVVAVAGQVSEAQIFAATEAVFGTWQGTTPPAGASASDRQQAPQALFVKDADSQTDLQLAFRAIPRPDQRLMTVRLLRRILAGGGSSRLHMRLREELGIVYSVDASIAAFDDAGAFAVDLSTAEGNLAVAVEEVLRETRRLAEELVPDDELARVKQSYLYDLEYSRDSAYDLANRYSWGELVGLVRSIEEEQTEASAVTAEYLRETARMIFAPERLNLVAVGPWSAATRKKAEKLLKAYKIGE
ncbi:MAG: insulinase family protein [Geobacter sp.]|nr:insulinase family protein [Geobacter sp.]